jgi:hypothetical protein
VLGKVKLMVELLMEQQDFMVNYLIEHFLHQILLKLVVLLMLQKANWLMVK